MPVFVSMISERSSSHNTENIRGSRAEHSSHQHQDWSTFHISSSRSHLTSTMLSFFASPDLRKFRGKQKKSEPSVKLKHVMWNNTELSRENEIVDKKTSSHTDSIDSIVLLRQHSSISSGSNNVRNSEDSWVSQQGSGGAFWFLRNRHDKFLGNENLKQSKSSIDESEEYLDTEESESNYATKVGRLMTRRNYIY